MRRLLIAGNWKMNLDCSGARELSLAICQRAPEFNKVDLLLCPPHVYLNVVAQAVAGSPVAVGGQNMYHEPTGAFTGEVSGAMLVDAGATAVILGHSERRHVLGETDTDVNRKVVAALQVNLTPILCVGELLAQREAGLTSEINRGQIEGSLAGLGPEQVLQIVIAYEPVWAIGTGKVATPKQAEEVHADLRRLLAERYNQAVADQVQILYGGSMKPGNARDLLEQPNVDGGLIGGASLKVDDFLGIAQIGTALGNNS
jgi:triosephosphate isomerase